MKILVVDDRHDILTLSEQRFRKEIKNGTLNFPFALPEQEAPDFLNAHYQEFVPTLSDINMLSMSGLQLLERVKEKFIAPPPSVIMATAYGDHYNYNAAMKLGAGWALTKLIDFINLKIKLAGNAAS